MKLKFLGCLIDTQADGDALESKRNGVRALAFSPNGRKMAVALLGDAHIFLYDESAQRRDKFGTKPTDAKFGKKSYVVNSVVFSPDSTKLAVGQTDNIVFVYRLGESWDEKKVICNKFAQSLGVAALVWPEEARLVIGLLDGKVRAGSTHSNKCATLYKLDAGVVALAQHPNRRSFASGHENGAIIVYSLESRTQTKICVHTSAPYCLMLSGYGILAAGADRRIVSYNAENGRILQDFDYSAGGGYGSGGGDETSSEKAEFYAAIADPTGHNVVFGSFNRLRLLCWNERRGAWSEDSVLNLRNFYTVTALAWKPDGTTIVLGGSGGAVACVDCCLKRTLLKNRFETTYISPSQVFIRDTKPLAQHANNELSGMSARNEADEKIEAAGRSGCVIRSAKSYAITALRVLGGQNGRRNYAVAHTPYTLIVADLENALCSEVAWEWSGSERFYLENEGVCMIVNAGEINFVEYGVDELLGWVRTERVNPHLMSVRVVASSRSVSNQMKLRRANQNPAALATTTPRGSARARVDERVCRVAYLLDMHTIAVVELVSGAQVAHIGHHNAIDWIELNESANKLLFRDLGLSLYLYALETPHATANNPPPPRCLLDYCSYVQWVPRSDAIVAQSGESLCVWYNSDQPSAASAVAVAEATAAHGGAAMRSTSSEPNDAVCFPIQGDVEVVLRDENHTEVIVVENNARMAYELDGAMIEFGTALNELDLSRALVFLERCEQVQQRAKNGGRTLGQAEDDSELTYDLAPMWTRLADAALQNAQLLIAQRCYAALNDYPKVKFLQETIEKAECALQQQHSQQLQYPQAQNDLLDEHETAAKGDYSSAAAIFNYFETRARVALLNKDFKSAERIYLENNASADAVEMYKRLGRWETAIDLANATGYAHADSLKANYYRMLNATGQQEKAAELRAEEGHLGEALQLYLDSGRPAHAARLMLERGRSGAGNALLTDAHLVADVINALLKHELFDSVGELLEATQQSESAIENYRKAKNFGKAIHAARKARPDLVIDLEEEWAEALCAEGNFEAAVSHFLESGKSLKAADAAIRGKEWSRAIEILDAVEKSAQHDEDDENRMKTSETVSSFYAEIARHFEANGEYQRAEKFYLDGGRPADAIEMYNRATRWADAYKLAAEFFGADDSRELYAQKAETLEEAGRLAEAENLYVSIGEPARAIAMYKRANRHDEMMRLVERFHGERATEMHKRLAEELEERGDLKTAEEHYLAAGDWSSAVEMYREAELFADAFRVAKTAASDENDGGGRDSAAASHACQSVAYVWAKSLGGDAAVKLLTRHAFLHYAIDIGIAKRDFDFVFELCNLGAKSRLADAQQKYAEHLEDEGDVARAEELYLKAGKEREAVLMHLHNENWEAAERLASTYSSSDSPSPLLVEVLVARGRAALEAKRAADAESFFLRASRADLILAYYRDVGAWTDALRVATKYAPDALPQLQNEYATAELAAGHSVGAQIFLTQAAECELQGDYQRAVDCYLKVDEESTEDVDVIVQAQTKAAQLIVKFLAGDEGIARRVGEIGERLTRLRQFSAAADVYELARMRENVVEALIEAREWTRARRIAAELSPAMAQFVERAYREYLREQGRVGELADVDASAAIDLLAERGDWDAALVAARQQNDRQLLDGYLLRRVAQLLENEDFDAAARLFVRYGVTLNAQAFNAYKLIIDMCMNQRNCSYEISSTLRDLIAQLNDKIGASSRENNKKVDERIAQIFQRYETALHLCALREALAPFGSAVTAPDNKEASDAELRNIVMRLRLQQSVAMLRYVDLFEPEKLFFEAGNACKSYGGEYEDMAFVFLNHCLDIADAIDEADATLVDNTLFQNTDIPQNFTLPQQHFLTETELEEMKEWVLATSVGRNITKTLKKDTRGVFEAAAIDPQTQRHYDTCAISGYPILPDAQVKELARGKFADAANWTIFQKLAHFNDNVFDVQDFLQRAK